MTKKRDQNQPTTLEEQYRALFADSVSTEEWAQVSSLEQPSLLKPVDSISMPGSYDNPYLYVGSSNPHAKLE